MNTKILEQLEETFTEEIKLANGNLDLLEALLQEKLQTLGNSLLQRLVNQSDKGYQGSSIACDCGGHMKFIQHRSKEIHTLFGWIKIERAYYHCPGCHKNLYPYDQTVGLGTEHLSCGLAKACCLLAVDDSFEQSSKKVEMLMGQKVSDNTIERLACQVGAVPQNQQDQQLNNFFDNRKIPLAENNPKRLYLAVDGTTVHETDGWHEAKVGVVYWENTKKEREKRYIGRFENSEKFGWHLWHQACKCGLREAEEVVYLGDGAGWIRTEHDHHFPRATFIIDWFHTSEHLWDCGKNLLGEGTKATEKWVEKRLDWLWQGRTKKLLNDLNIHLKKHRGIKRKTLQALIRYVSTNQQQMRYDVFRAKGYDIGSGAVEGACKNLVGKRLKQSGMIWTRQGSASVLSLRTTWLNGQWLQLWQTKPLAA